MEFVSGWGKVLENGYVLLAGKMLKLFCVPKCASSWGNAENVQMLKMGGTMSVHIRHRYTNMAPPILTFLTF